MLPQAATPGGLKQVRGAKPNIGQTAEVGKAVEGGILDAFFQLDKLNDLIGATVRVEYRMHRFASYGNLFRQRAAAV